MEDGAEGRSEGEVFDTIVDEYDRHRLGYAKALVDRAARWRASVRVRPYLRSVAARGS